MRTDDELKVLADQLSDLHTLPPGEDAKKFLAVCGHLTGEEVQRMGQLCQKEAYFINLFDNAEVTNP